MRNKRRGKGKTSTIKKMQGWGGEERQKQHEWGELKMVQFSQNAEKER